MRGVATSDLHLGFRQFAALVDGRNARERDVEIAWERVVQRIIDAKPDLVTIAGDVFHNVRPSFHAVRAWQRGIRRIVEETDAHVVVILGNHESPRTAETLSPVVVVEGERRVHVVTQPKRIQLATGRIGSGHREMVSIACFPFGVLDGSRAYSIEPDPQAQVNVLLIHAAVRSSSAPGALPVFYAGEHALDIAKHADRWDVVACGDFHEYRQLVPDRLAFYSGSIERTSSNIWQEWAPKGVIAYDTATGEQEFIEIPTRSVDTYDLGDFDLPPGATAEQLNGCLRKMLGHARAAGAVTRFVVDGFNRGDRDSIDWPLVRQLKQYCLHFQLDLRYAADAGVDLGDRRDHRGRTLEDAAREYFADDPADVRACAFGFLGLEAA